MQRKRCLSWLALEPFRLGNGLRHIAGAAIKMEQAKVHGPAGWIFRSAGSLIFFPLVSEHLKLELGKIERVRMRLVAKCDFTHQHTQSGAWAEHPKRAAAWLRWQQQGIAGEGMWRPPSAGFCCALQCFRFKSMYGRVALSPGKSQSHDAGPSMLEPKRSRTST